MSKTRRRNRSRKPRKTRERQKSCPDRAAGVNWVEWEHIGVRNRRTVGRGQSAQEKTKTQLNYILISWLILNASATTRPVILSFYPFCQTKRTTRWKKRTCTLWSSKTLSCSGWKDTTCRTLVRIWALSNQLSLSPWLTTSKCKTKISNKTPSQTIQTCKQSPPQAPSPLNK